MVILYLLPSPGGMRTENVLHANCETSQVTNMEHSSYSCHFLDQRLLTWPDGPPNEICLRAKCVFFQQKQRSQLCPIAEYSIKYLMYCINGYLEIFWAISRETRYFHVTQHYFYMIGKRELSCQNTKNIYFAANL